jgi:hypothetical protein
LQRELRNDENRIKNINNPMNYPRFVRNGVTSTDAIDFYFRHKGLREYLELLGADIEKGRDLLGE